MAGLPHPFLCASSVRGGSEPVVVMWGGSTWKQALAGLLADAKNRRTPKKASSAASRNVTTAISHLLLNNDDDMKRMKALPKKSAFLLQMTITVLSKTSNAEALSTEINAAKSLATAPQKILRTSRDYHLLEVVPHDTSSFTCVSHHYRTPLFYSAYRDP